ncbi:cell division cycle-associated 7-like protein [Oryza brachyantha]|uniref:Zinc-finger domain-containing protein n=1 Tax=Oryza brachyantha TaxID=4533 RepID=J3N932_ORYBR|nr:cell division cycle-associated 7-like protein [Oryza brachyantha]
MVSTRGVPAGEGAAPAAQKRRGRPPKAPPAPAAEEPRSPVSPLVVAAAESPAEGYEREREARIRENMERMQKLGILDLASRFNRSASGFAGGGSGSGRGRRKAPVAPGSVGAVKTKPASPSPARRSLRLKSIEPVSYCEIRTKRDKDIEGGNSVVIEVGSKEEVYTEEHDKLLGTIVEPWTLFVDGYGKDGKRIYDQVRGQTCHQCRQKTLGHHTRCCKCQIVQGQYCGDCLYMRYGENVLEAKNNPNWICPVCRGICNCSICRTKKGWFPTGCAYRKVVSLGYKSVAHYLIATQRASVNPGDSSSADSNKVAATTKSEASSASENAPVSKDNQDNTELSSKAVQVKEADHQVNNNPTDDSDKDDSRSESVVTSDSQDCQVNLEHGCATPSKPCGPKKRKLVERSPDCVASRLRSHSNRS